MVWTSQEQIQRARRKAPVIDSKSLLGLATAMGIKNEPGPSNRELLSGLLGHKDERVTQYLQGVTRGAKAWLTLPNLRDILVFASLPEGFAHADIAEVLVGTGRLVRDVEGRATRTAGEVLALVQGLLSEEGRGLIQAMKLGERLRDLGRSHDTRAARADGTQAMNQVALSYAVLTYSLLPFEVLARVGGDLPDRGVQSASVEMWRVVGSLLGVDADGLPESPEDAWALLKLIRQSAECSGTSEAAQQLGAAFAAWALSAGELDTLLKYAGDALVHKLGIAI